MKKTLRTLISLILMLFACSLTVDAATYYVSSSGNSSNAGTSESAPLSSLSVAYAKCTGKNNTIILLDAASFANPPSHSGTLTIQGKTSNVTLTLPSQITLAGALKLDSLNLSGGSTVYANGYLFEIGSTVTADSRMTVYGGGTTAITGDTNLRLLGGKFSNIYGGGNGGKITGNTNVVLGGTANAGDGIDDQNSSTLSPSFVYGGGKNAPVTGKTNVTLEGNAVARYLVGAGTDTNGTATDTNIYIKGGKVMNVYGGSQSTTLPAGTKTHITITGGLAEALFGGCESVAMNGHTFITLDGGDVSRRVYTGCYNETNTLGTSFKSDRYVTGTTVLTITNKATAKTGTGLSLLNMGNMGVFSGSRTKAQHDAEQNTVIYLDNCYESKKSLISTSSWSSFKSFADYVVKAGTGGTVLGTTTAKTAYAQPDYGNYAKINSAYYINENFTTASTIDVTFETNFSLATPTATQNEQGVLASVNVVAKNVKNETQPQVLFALYDDNGTFVTGGCKNVSASDTQAQVQLNGDLTTGETYQLRAFLWSANQKVLMTDTVTNITIQ